jgi:hypothetical protein
MASNRIGFSANALKIIAAITMMLDHIGVLLLPAVPILRIIGRISFPIFAFMISEGCFYTKNKLRYFLSVFMLGALCQAIYYIYEHSMYFNVLITFSIAILAVYALEYMKKALFYGDRILKKIFAVLLFVFSVVSVYLLNLYLKIDYGFWGCMMPAFAAFFKMPKDYVYKYTKFEHLVSLLSLGVALLLLSFSIGWYQPYSLFALPLLLLYSGKRGRLKMKYFFYVFYPLHLLALQGIAYLMN